MTRCPNCDGEAVIKYGRIHNGKRRLQCKDCGRQFTPEAVWRKISDETKALIDRLLVERLSLAGIARAVGVSEFWLQRYVNRKFRSAPAPSPAAAPTAGAEKGGW